ncbi:hypothetical protein PoB_006216700 [Plakobranchus ocellatus]|uniref:Uncharacterized protein n=1 Tax=Plakobranchus ocellatus TaxID=259542 RepID=A0AAV4CUT0_9GAST|nr:hypothetical protein PoB_006216700 [Plakobranchus ocellatus]
MHGLGKVNLAWARGLAGALLKLVKHLRGLSLAKLSSQFVFVGACDCITLHNYFFELGVAKIDGGTGCRKSGSSHTAAALAFGADSSPLALT